MLSMVLFNCWMPVTVLICAICEVICALSIGFMGSWLFNCATSSFRKRSCAAAGSVFELLVVFLLLRSAVLATLPAP